MLTLLVVRRIIDHLRRPFIQRLITLVVSALLAMSLISTTMQLALPPAGHEVASSAFGRITLPAHLDASRVQMSLASMTHAHGQADARATQHDDRERRLV